MKKFNLVAGHKGLDNILSNVVILEYESIMGNYEDFNEGDFVLTSLFFAKENHLLIKEAFENLIKRGISGIAIKTVYFDNIDKELKNLAEINSIPIFIFDSIYMEDIIINVNEFIKKNAHYFIIEEKVKNLLKVNNTKEKVYNISKEIYPQFNENIVCAYIEKLSDLGATQSYREFNKLIYRRASLKNLSNGTLIKYDSGFFIIYHFYKSYSESSILKKLESLINSLLINRSEYRVGINSNIHKLDELDLSLKKALYAFKMSEYDKERDFSFKQVKENSFILALLENKISNEYYNNCMKILLDYDKNYNSDLVYTLTTYVECNGNIKKTSDKLYQHQNTVRYRIGKIKDLFDIKNDNLFFTQSFLIISMYKFNNILDK
jgi:sugar diacid utilization regulator